MSSIPFWFFYRIAQCPQGVQPKNWKMLNKLNHWNHFCSNGWKILPVHVPNPEKNHILLDRSLSENFTIKMNGNIILSCAVSIMQVSHTVFCNTTYDNVAVWNFWQSQSYHEFFLGETYLYINQMFLVIPDFCVLTHCHKWLLCLSNFLFNLGWVNLNTRQVLQNLIINFTSARVCL